MALHGWRLYAVIGLIFIYVTGILVLSTINLQTRRIDLTARRGRFEEINRLRRWEVTSLNKGQTVHWCSPLRFIDTHSHFNLTGPIGVADSEQKSTQNSSMHPQRRERQMEVGLTALASFPGSGNTWLRYLLQQATGFLTGSIYKDYGLLKSGFPAENICNQSVLLIKTHEWGPKAWRNFDKAILLVRDPDKAILAEFNRQSGGHIGFASPDRYKRTKGRYWKQFVTNKILGWEMMNLSWARDFTGHLKIVYYDDLVKDVETVLREILSFINYPIDEEQLSCALQRKEGIYRRKKRLLTFDPYSPAMHDYIQRKKQHVYEALGRHM